MESNKIIQVVRYLVLQLQGYKKRIVQTQMFLNRPISSRQFKNNSEFWKKLNFIKYRQYIYYLLEYKDDEVGFLNDEV